MRSTTQAWVLKLWYCMNNSNKKILNYSALKETHRKFVVWEKVDVGEGSYFLWKIKLLVIKLH